MEGIRPQVLFFTARDRGISGKGDRDLLGLQPIASLLGRRLVKQLTNRSDNARALSASLLFAHIYDRYRRDRETPLDLMPAMFVLEQVFAYALLATNEQTSGIPGIRIASSRWLEHGDAVKVSPGRDYQLIQGQGSQGLFARNATPLRLMGLFERDFDGVNWGDDDPRAVFDGVDLLEQRLVGFLTTVEQKDPCKLNAIQNWNATAEALISASSTFSEASRTFWKTKLDLVDSIALELVRHRWDHRDEPWSKTVDSLIAAGCDRDSVLAQIRLTERYLTALQAWFDVIVASRSLPLARAWVSQRPALFAELVKRWEAFRQLPELPGEAGARLRRLKAIDPRSGDFDRQLVSHHSWVSGGLPVIDLDGDGRIRTSRPDWQDESPTIPDLGLWRRSYYMAPLCEVAQVVFEDQQP